MGNYGGNHLSAQPTVAEPNVEGRRRRSAWPVAGLAGVALAGSAVIGGAPTLTAATELAAQTYYLRGTNIGTVPPDAEYAAWADAVIDQTVGTHDPAEKVPYPGGFWFFSKGGFSDPTYDKSVAEGLASLKSLTGDDTGVIIYGFSQGAVVATEYKREKGAVGNTYVLVANPNRPNGGILERFTGVHVPIFDVSFNGATPTDGDTTYDIARQYDGWADFPKYPLNLLATANAFLGILYLHGKYDRDIDPAVLDDPTKTDKSVHGDTTYYLIHTDRLPLLMPLEWIVPGQILDAIDAPLRVLVELGYDRTDYGDPQSAGLIPNVNPLDVTKDLVDATARGVAVALSGKKDTATTQAVAPTSALRSDVMSAASEEQQGDSQHDDAGQAGAGGTGSSGHAASGVEVHGDSGGAAGDEDADDAGADVHETDAGDRADGNTLDDGNDGAHVTGGKQTGVQESDEDGDAAPGGTGSEATEQDHSGQGGTASDTTGTDPTASDTTSSHTAAAHASTTGTDSTS
ncbi:MAG: PE-PPE domain-containing protein [Mycobacterium sp.]|nr:PE-PPE domain-containing protein [Mycobacterium sp.]